MYKCSNKYQFICNLIICFIFFQAKHFNESDIEGKLDTPKTLKLVTRESQTDQNSWLSLMYVHQVRDLRYHMVILSVRA